MQNIKITDQMLFEHGLSKEEYESIKSILRREPSWVELGIFSVMWSEHASYKNSITLLKTLPKEGPFILAKAGEENAGVVDIGNGLAVVFKIESHNHPSALEPYHGAATGVGGILRDVFTMGARPIAVLNSLRFGNPNNPHVQHILRGVINGIADYGNCFGVPTVGGEIYFEDCYEGNPLVNAMAVGIVHHDKIAKSSAKGVGNYVVYVGAKTGRDGIHGATFASVELSEESEDKRTAVQVGDPFMEKLLMEATLEAIQANVVVAIQDMGAAGLTCSSSEMAGKGGVGIELNVALVPQRESGMTPYEIMLSESQERMLLIVEPSNYHQVKTIFKKWDLDAVIIGKVTDDGYLRIKYNDEIFAEIPAKALILGGDAPVYKREMNVPSYFDVTKNFNQNNISEPTNFNDVLSKIIQSPNISSKKSVFQQYDHMVQINTMIEPGSDAAVIKVKNTNMALAMTTDCNSRYCYLDPYMGTLGAVAEAARNVVCSGAKPIAITNCLNFGNPYKPEVYWTFSETIRGMSDACRSFQTPVTGGNVSFYNENPTNSIYPTPVIGMLGILENFEHRLDQYYKEIGDIIILLGDHCKHIDASEYLKIIHKQINGNPPEVVIKNEQILHSLVLELNNEKLLCSAHDCSEGGLVVCIAESCFTPYSKNIPHNFNSLEFVGAKLSFPITGRKDAVYFGEAHGRIIISIHPHDYDKVISIIDKYKYPYQVLGEVIKDILIINDDINIFIKDLYKLWSDTICM